MKTRTTDPELHDQQDMAPADVREPSWFLDAANDQPHDLLMARYRQTLNHDGRPFAIPVSGEMERSASRPVAVRHRGSPDAIRRAGSRSKPRQPSWRQDPERAEERRSDMAYMALALGAMVAGVSIGFGLSHFGTIKDTVQATFVHTSQEPPASPVKPGAQLQTVTATVIEKSPVAAAILEVSDAAGRANTLIPLSLRAVPSQPQQELIVKLTGLPESAYLTAGRKEAAKVWTLSLKDLEGVQLMVPEGGDARIDLAVAAFESRTGELIAPVKTMAVMIEQPKVEPAAAPPPTALPVKDDDPATLSPIPQPASTGIDLPATATDTTISQGDVLLEAGDAEGAREFYQQAYSAGQLAAAFGIARSYDPLIHEQFKVNQGKPNPSLALQWYERAATAGQTEAMAAIARLKTTP